jgi:O-antigen/teichoic acid export membrane protein
MGNINLSSDLKSSSIIFGALLTGIIVFSAASIAINQMNGPFIIDSHLAEIFLIVVIAISAICLFSAHMIYNKRVQRIQQSTVTLREKLEQYRAALILYLALTEGPALFSIISFLLFGNFRFLAITVILLVNMFMKRPSKSRLIEDLQLDIKEQEGLES